MCLSYAFIHQNPDLEKTSAYECGFNPFEDARNKFDVRFYVVDILFIIFDLESPVYRLLRLRYVSDLKIGLISMYTMLLLYAVQTQELPHFCLGRLLR